MRNILRDALALTLGAFLAAWLLNSDYNTASIEFTGGVKWNNEVKK